MANWPKFYILIVARIIILLPLLQYFIFSGISNCAYRILQLTCFHCELHSLIFNNSVNTRYG